MIAGRMDVLSDMAEGEKSVKTPILQMMMKMT